MKNFLTILFGIFTLVQGMDESPNDQVQYPDWTLRLDSRRINICHGMRGRAQYSHISFEYREGFSVLFCKMILPGLIPKYDSSNEAALANLTLSQIVNLDFKLYEYDPSASPAFNIFDDILEKVRETYNKSNYSPEQITSDLDDELREGRQKPFCFFIEYGHHKLDFDELVFDLLLKNKSVPVKLVLPPLLKMLTDVREEEVKLYVERFDKRFRNHNLSTKLDKDAIRIVFKYLCPVGFIPDLNTLVKHILTTAAEQAA